jgi:hypothetical protein
VRTREVSSGISKAQPLTRIGKAMLPCPVSVKAEANEANFLNRSRKAARAGSQREPNLPQFDVSVMPLTSTVTPALFHPDGSSVFSQ